MQKIPPRVVLLANGSEKRWDHYLGMPKQMVPFNGEPNIERTIREVKAYTDDIWLVTWNDEIHPRGAGRFKVEPTTWLAETTYLSKQLWQGRTIILLGDVFFSRHALRKIFSAQDDLVIFGRIGRNHYTGCGHSELFGAAFNPAAQGRLLLALEQVIEDTQHGEYGKLWQVYNKLANRAPRSKTDVPGLLCQISDYTDDLDWPEEYHRVKKIYDLAARPSILAQVELWVRLGITRARAVLSPFKQRCLKWLKQKRPS